MNKKHAFNLPQDPGDIKISPKLIITVIVIAALVWGCFSSFYTVQAESQGVVLRFGQYRNTVDSGLRFKLPFGIDRVYILPVKRQLKKEFGFGTSGATNRSQFATSNSEQNEERRMVTADLSAASVEWIIQYRVEEPRLFLFEVRRPEMTLRNISESVMRTVVGDRTVDEVITIGRQEIEVEALLRLRELSKKYELGLYIDQVQLKDVNPPHPVQPSFNEVNEAQQEREKMINVANGEYNKVIPRAKGVAEQKIQAAEGYALKRVNESMGDVARFNLIFEQYAKAPDVTKKRLYFETMKNVVPKMGKKIIMDEEAKNILPFLQLDTEQKQNK